MSSEDLTNSGNTELLVTFLSCKNITLNCFITVYPKQTLFSFCWRGLLIISKPTGEVRQTLKWADTKAIKNEIDMQVLNCIYFHKLNIIKYVSEQNLKTLYFV